MKHNLFTFLLFNVFLFGQSFAQDSATTDFFAQIKKYDLSTLLMTDSIFTEDREDTKEMVRRAEILGFIGVDYQRFYIHFISIIQNPINPYEYFAYGKTKVRETICPFQGTITIIQSGIYKSLEFPEYEQGFAICDVVLYEDKKQPSAGFIKGRLTSNFLIDNKGQFRYDALMYHSDVFSNNEFSGNWISYKTGISKKCNWGDHRIPDCGDLDIGAAEFSVNDKYLKNGWENYILSLFNNPVKPEVIKAKQKENEQWWK